MCIWGISFIYLCSFCCLPPPLLVSRRELTVFPGKTSKFPFYLRNTMRMDFHWQEPLGCKRSSELFCYPPSGWTRKILIKEFYSSSAFSAILEIFLCSPFANTTDCMSPSHINIWWCRTPAMINKDSGMCHHPSPNSLVGRSAGAHTANSAARELFVSHPLALYLLSPRH